MSEVVSIGPAPDRLDDDITGERQPVDSRFDKEPLGERLAREAPPNLVSTGDLSDLALLPRRFDQFAHHVETKFDLLIERLFPTLDRINERLDDADRWRAEVDTWRADTDRRLAALERQQRPTRRTRKVKK